MQRLPLFLRMMRRRTRKGSPARYDVHWERALAAPGAEGDPLLTDHYAPVTDEPRPTVLIRSPYIRGGFPWNYLYGALVAEQGFHVLLQSSRGTGGSGGQFHFWHNEAADGRAAVEWLREQEWFNGDLYTLGPSYCAFSQLALGTDPPPEWRGAVMQVGLADPRDFFWHGGVFNLERSLIGGLALFNEQSMTVKDNIKAILRMQLRLKRAIREVPLLDAYPALFGERRPAFEEWLEHPSEDGWTSFMPVADTLEVPTSLCTGWWDLAVGQVIEQYQRMAAAGHDVDLLIGPWTHTSALREGWGEVFPQAMRRLRGQPPAYAVRVHVGGTGEWRDLPSWPPPGTRSEPWSLRELAGPGDLSFRYDPADPTPSIGGPLQSPAQGQRDNAPLEGRPDVITFTGAALTTPLEVMGPVRAEIDATTTAASGDLFVRLCDVDPDGRSINVCDGLAQITAGRTTVKLDDTAHVFRPGHRVRLLVAGGAHPRYLRNYGTGEPPGPATRMVPTTTTVRDTSTLTLTLV